MFIEPIQLMEPIQFGSVGRGAGAAAGGKNASGLFGEVFAGVWNAAADTQQDLAEKQYLQSIGEIDDTHTVPIAATKAELSLTLLVNLRNKALEAYNELMRMGV